jgi:hypothetical protein
MQTCYVALPGGIRPDPSGRMLDFECLYKEVIQPAILNVAAGIDAAVKAFLAPTP